MRIKDLATRATKLLTGNAWFVVDNGTKVEKAAFSEVVKQGIEEYAGSTLAGSARTVKSAIDALNSNSFTNPTTLTSSHDMNDIYTPGIYRQGGTDMPAHSPYAQFGGSVDTFANASITVTKARENADTIQVWTSTNSRYTYIRSQVGRSGAWSSWILQPTRAEVDALNSKEIFDITASTGTWSSEITLNDASYAYRLGSITMIHLNLKIESSTKKNLLITSVLPETMRPRFKVQAVATDGDIDGLCHLVSIEPTGTISFWNTKTGTTYLQADIIYITKNGTL